MLKQVYRCFDVSAHYLTGGTIAQPKASQFEHVFTNGQKFKVTLYNANTQKGQPGGRIVRVVPHWSAGGRLQCWDDYQLTLIEDAEGEIYVLRSVPQGMKGQHLAGRNTGAFGVAAMAMGPKDVSDNLFEAWAKVIGEACHKYGLDPRGKTADGFNVIGDHAEYAKADGYYPERWDVGSQEHDPSMNLMTGTRSLRSKAAWYHAHIQFVAGKPVYEFAAVL